MFKQILLTGALLALAPSVLAQNASQIQSVQSGHSCSGCNLFQADLSYRDLPGIDLSGSRLRQADLSVSTMNGSDFESANLTVANLFAGRFTSANFRNADLSEAYLVGGYFGGADFSGANLTHTNLSGADMATTRGLTQSQLDRACGDEYTVLPKPLRIPVCRRQ